MHAPRLHMPLHPLPMACRVRACVCGGGGGAWRQQHAGPHDPHRASQGYERSRVPSRTPKLAGSEDEGIQSSQLGVRPQARHRHRGAIRLATPALAAQAGNYSPQPGGGTHPDFLLRRTQICGWRLAEPDC